MNSAEQCIEKAALLHDIGKMVLRARPGKYTHSKAGADFLSPFLTTNKKEILNSVSHHHSDLALLNTAVDDIAYLIYEADNLAASSDRRKNEDNGSGFSVTMPLKNVFNVFSGDESSLETAYYLRGLMEEQELLYPLPQSIVKASSDKYENLVQYLEENFNLKSPSDMTCNELLRILEATMSYVPSSTAKDEVADISLYDHVKLTAAFAICMYRYLLSHNITDYKTSCYGAEQKKLRGEPVYLLVSGDISGIQSFIYTIPSQGALKSLRGRSFYLDILLENIVDEILTACDVSRSCLLYTGGGHFYLLLPNTKEIIGILEQVSQKINDFFLTYFGNRLYLAMTWESCSGNEFSANVPGGAGNVYHRLSEKISKEKLCRYSELQLQKLFDPESEYNKVRPDNRECSICHISTSELAPYNKEDDENACPVCCSLYEFGKKILESDVFVISDQASKDSLILPGWDRCLYLSAASAKRLKSDDVLPIRLYVKNKMYTGSALATQIWLGDYVSRVNGHIMEFKDFASLSGEDEKTGISRLGVMRADVDNLGAAFIAGFSDKYATLTRTATLSRQLSLFFKRYINELCAGNLNGIGEEGKERFSLFSKPKNYSRNVHIVYSGGDDMFLVGAWDDLIELSVDIYRAFRQFTNQKLSFSAGIGLFHEKCPVVELARKTGELEDFAKGNPGKDSIALFGIDSEIHSPEGAGEKNIQRYSWERFVSKVCEEKLFFLLQNFKFGDECDVKKLRIGKSGLYRMLNLLETEKKKENAVNLARFAYVIGRMEPTKTDDPAYPAYAAIRKQFYSWYKNQEDREELSTAIQFIIYKMRDKEAK